jgi:hypothetical protein
MQLHLVRGSSVASCFVAMLRLGEQNCSLRMLLYKTHKGCFKVSDQKERKSQKLARAASAGLITRGVASQYKTPAR